MFGIEDPIVALAYLLCIVSSGFCVIYAWRNWNHGNDTVEPDDIRWEKEEEKVEDNL
jgi:hypothetical protein